MPDRAKTIKELDRIVSVLHDSLTLLQEKKPVKPEPYMDGSVVRYKCGYCGKHLVCIGITKNRDNYCSTCGTEVDWE